MMDSEKSKKAKEYLTSRKFNEQDLKRYDISFIDSNVEEFQNKELLVNNKKCRILKSV